METSIIEIKLYDGTKWNVFCANSTQNHNMILWYNANKDKVKSFEFIVKGIHTTKQFIGFIDLSNIKVIYLEYLGITINVSSPDEWQLVELNGETFDVHYCEEYGTISTYEYNAELDNPTHRYKTLHTQKN